MDCSSPDSSVRGIFQARIQEWVAIPPPGELPEWVAIPPPGELPEWVAIPPPGELPDPGNEPGLLHWQVDSFTSESPGKPLDSLTFR